MAKVRAKLLPDHERPLVLVSPDGRVVIGFCLVDNWTEGERLLRHTPVWQVAVDGLPILAPSPLSAAVAGEPPLATGFTLRRVVRRQHDTETTLAVTLVETVGLRRSITWRFRCDTECVSVGFSLPRQPGLPRLFCLQGDTSRWVLPPGAVARGDGVTGSAVVRYSHGRCALASGWGRFEVESGHLRLAAGGADLVRAPIASAWRTLRLGRRPCDLAASGTPIPPAATGGAILRDATFSTHGGLVCVRLAAHTGARYVLYDIGWCGDPADSETTGCTDTPDERLTRRVAGWSGLDVAAVARAGAPENIGVLLALSWELVARSSQELLAIYARWGVTGVVLSGFTSHDAATAARLAAWVALAAEYQLLCIIADAAWYDLPLPDNLTRHVVEGEAAATAAGITERLFVRRGLGVVQTRAGCASPQRTTTRTHQMALPFVAGDRFPVLFDGSALECVDRGALEVTLWRGLPHDGHWDEECWLRGEPGEYAVVARRTGTRWFVSGVNGPCARVQTVRLEDALPPGGRWHLTLYRDAHAQDAALRGDTVVEMFSDIRANDRVRLEIAASGGFVLLLEPDPGDHV